MGLAYEEGFDMRNFEINMRKILRMNTRCDVEERILRLQSLLINFVADTNLEEVVEEHGV